MEKTEKIRVTYFTGKSSAVSVNCDGKRFENKRDMTINRNRKELKERDFVLNWNSKEFHVRRIKIKGYSGTKAMGRVHWSMTDDSCRLLSNQNFPLDVKVEGDNGENIQ